MVESSADVGWAVLKVLSVDGVPRTGRASRNPCFESFLLLFRIAALFPCEALSALVSFQYNYPVAKFDA